MNIKIIVASHKPYKMPDDVCYLPLHVGKAGKEPIGYRGDDTGENISEKNPNYCELTGLYWAWKNLDADYLGLVHYRRHFSAKPFLLRLLKGKQNCILNDKEVRRILSGTDIILPVKRHYWIETLYSHYCHTHYPRPLDETRKILEEDYSEMLPVFDQVMKRKSAHMFNMYIMKRELSDAYCEFLFDVLQKLENRIDISGYDAFQARVYGRISELLLDVWISYKGYSYRELPLMHMEKINWFAKGWKFLYSKLAHRYY
ncbi:MAG: DUF4422 domain-containing protein [Lachnospiraceae bacterium]|nr:DUF4422 domain-containing protein [Lachnospiraceae bacterium]